MSGVKKVSVPAAPAVEAKPVVTRPTEVQFPSVKDLKAKFNSGNAVESEQVIIRKKEQQIRHSYAHGNSKLEITGPITTDNKRNSKTPTTPTTPTTPKVPTTLKVKTTSNPLFDNNGTSKQNGAITPTSPPTKGFQNQQRSSVILRVQAGERVSSQQETVEVRKKVISDVSSMDSVRRLTSQFNEMRNQPTVVSKTSAVEIPKKIIQEVEKEKFEEERENLFVAAEVIENVVEERISDHEDYQDESLVNGRRLSTPRAEFLHSMNDREEANYESGHERQEDNELDDLQIQLNNEQEENQFEEFQFHDSPSEHENTYEQNEEGSEHHEDLYEHHEEHHEHHEEHREHHESAYEQEESHEEHNENAYERDEAYEEHHESHDEPQENDYEHYEHQDNASEHDEPAQHNDIYSEIGHEESENNFESAASEVIEEIIENNIQEHLNEHEEEQED